MTAPLSLPLGSIASFIRGITFKPKDTVPTGTAGAVDCMRTRNVQTQLDLSDVWGIPIAFVKRPEQFLQAGDVLVSSANSWNLVGKCCWVPTLPRAATFGGFTSVLRANPTRVEPRYLYHWFSAPRTQKLARSFGQQTTNIANLNLERCLSLPVPIPTLSEQRRIADILDKADALRAKRRAALALLDTLTQSIFLDMFGDPATNPKAWPIAPLSECVDTVQIGPFGAMLHQSDYGIGGIPLVNPKHIVAGAIEVDEAETVNAEKFAALGPYQLRSGDVVLGRRGEMGRCAMVDPARLPLLCGTGSAYIRPREGTTTSSYLWALLSSEWGRAELTRRALGQTLLNLNSKLISTLEVPVPTIEPQQHFAEALQSVKTLKATAEASLAHLDALFASLQHRAFRGEL